MNPLSGLIEQLSKLPSIGQKSAQRLAFFLLSLPTQEVEKMASVMVTTKKTTRYCNTCFNISTQDTCHICQNNNRDKHTLCVVAEPRDIFALERTHDYRGLYHVLGGLVSPLDGVHPESLRVPELINRIKHNTFNEIILAINPTIEGDATLLYLQDVLTPYSVKITKLAYGLPAGSDIDYADELTLQKALMGRS